VTAESTDQYFCPACGGSLCKKRSRRGPFLGCIWYPDCLFTMDCTADGAPIDSNGMPPIEEWDGWEIPQHARYYQRLMLEMLDRADLLRGDMAKAAHEALLFTLFVTSGGGFLPLGANRRKVELMLARQGGRR
jgi:ssDNA-binding Zn-finger/Zn-ribbon topoisomerase 1